MTEKMDKGQIFGRLTDIFRDVFEEDDIVATPSMTAEDVEGWTSLAHIRLILVVEQSFGIRFSAAQTSSLANVGDLATLIEKKLQA